MTAINSGISSSAAPTTTSSSTSSPIAQVSSSLASSSQQSSSSNTVEIVAGIAVHLRVFLLGTVGFLAYRKRRRKKLVEELVAQKLQLNGGTTTILGPSHHKEYHSSHYGSPLELETAGRGGREELGSNGIHEVGGLPR